jgi:EpsI family protein
MDKKISVFAILCLVTCFFVYWNVGDRPSGKKPPLKQYFLTIQGYETIHQIELPESNIKMLKLDDYIFSQYKGEKGVINLYIGSYYDSKKAYASHSPEFCYPSQGWKVIVPPETYSLKRANYQINYNEIVTSLRGQRELVLYWYQSHLSTNTQVYKNKIDMAINKLKKLDPSHAFIRVSIPFGDFSYQATKDVAIQFINAFYPILINYVHEGS